MLCSGVAQGAHRTLPLNTSVEDCQFLTTCTNRILFFFSIPAPLYTLVLCLLKILLGKKFGKRSASLTENGIRTNTVKQHLQKLCPTCQDCHQSFYAAALCSVDTLKGATALGR